MVLGQNYKSYYDVMYCCKVTRSFDFDEKKEIERERVRVRLSERDIEQT